MRISVLAIKEARLCAFIFNESLSPGDVVKKSVGARFQYLAEINVSNVGLIDNAICPAHGTVDEYSGLLTLVASELLAEPWLTTVPITSPLAGAPPPELVSPVPSPILHHPTGE